LSAIDTAIAATLEEGSPVGVRRYIAVTLFEAA
jgi:hypothetical protein